MSERNICRIGDTIVGTCNGPGRDHPRSCTGVWVTGSDTGVVDDINIVRVGDTGVTDCGHTFFAVTGSELCQCDERNVVCVGDTVNIQGGSGVTVTGSDTAKAF